VAGSVLLLVRQLCDAGLAHRDIKPANLMVPRRQETAGGCLPRPGPPLAVAGG